MVASSLFTHSSLLVTSYSGHSAVWGYANLTIDLIHDITQKHVSGQDYPRHWPGLTKTLNRKEGVYEVNPT